MSGLAEAFLANECLYCFLLISQLSLALLAHSWGPPMGRGAYTSRRLCLSEGDRYCCEQLGLGHLQVPAVSRPHQKPALMSQHGVLGVGIQRGVQLWGSPYSIA